MIQREFAQQAIAALTHHGAELIVWGLGFVIMSGLGSASAVGAPVNHFCKKASALSSVAFIAQNLANFARMDVKEQTVQKRKWLLGRLALMCSLANLAGFREQRRIRGY